MHQKVTPVKAVKQIYKVVDILPEYLDLIIKGTKKLEFRKWHSKASHFMLKNTETGKIEAIVEIGEVFDLNLLDEESRETVLDEGQVSEEFRETYDCRYCYMLDKVHNVH